jgi:CRISPR-associated protein Cst2
VTAVSFLSGVLLIDAPASALNNAGTVEGARTENLVAVKQIRTRQGAYPYVSAQAFRNWLRTTLEKAPELGWRPSPIFREAKIAYTDGDPLEYWDDDLFGYMRAPGKRADAKASREKAGLSETTIEITRTSPLRVGTLVSIAPVTPTDDFGTMGRQNGDAVPHEHQFYRTVLKGLFSLNLQATGTFTYHDRAGHRNLDEIRIKRAQERGLEHLEAAKAYRLPLSERAARAAAVFKGLGLVYGGAKLALHYTDVTPAVFAAVVLRGGNNPLQYCLGADEKGLPRVNVEALLECAKVWRDQIASPLYFGWVQGFHDAQHAVLIEALKEAAGQHLLPGAADRGYVFGHPRDVLNALARDLEANASRWMA